MAKPSPAPADARVRLHEIIRAGAIDVGFFKLAG